MPVGSPEGSVWVSQDWPSNSPDLYRAGEFDITLAIRGDRSIPTMAPFPYEDEWAPLLSNLNVARADFGGSATLGLRQAFILPYR